MDINLRDILPGVIGGFVGASVGALLAWGFRELSDWMSRGRQARYLAIRVVCVLDKYVEDCADVACDDGERDQRGYLEAEVSTPQPPEFPPDLDWRSIDHTLTYRLLSMDNEARAANRRIDFVDFYIADPPDRSEYFEERQDQYITIGFRAFAMTQELREKYEIPPQKTEKVSPVDRLNRAKAELEDFRRRRDERRAALPVPAIV